MAEDQVAPDDLDEGEYFHAAVLGEISPVLPVLTGAEVRKYFEELSKPCADDGLLPAVQQGGQHYYAGIAVAVGGDPTPARQQTDGAQHKAKDQQIQQVIQPVAVGGVPDPAVQSGAHQAQDQQASQHNAGGEVPAPAVQLQQAVQLAFDPVIHHQNNPVPLDLDAEMHEITVRFARMKI